MTRPSRSGRRRWSGRAVRSSPAPGPRPASRRPSWTLRPWLPTRRMLRHLDERRPGAYRAGYGEARAGPSVSAELSVAVDTVRACRLDRRSRDRAGGKRGRADMPLTVQQVIKLIEADGWTLVRVRGQPSSLRPRNQAGCRDRARQAEPGLARRYRAQHPEAGWDQREAVVSTYAIIIERAGNGGYGAWSPDLPGCVALGDTEGAR